MIDGSDFVVSRVGQLAPCYTDLDASVGKLKDFDVFADVAPVARRILDQVHLALVAQGKAVCDLSIFAPCKDSFQIFILAEGSVRVVSIARKFAEAAIVIVDEAWHELIGAIDRCSLSSLTNRS